LLGGGATEPGTVGGSGDQIGGDVAMSPTVSGKESRGKVGFRTGIRGTDDCSPETGNQAAAGDGLGYGQWDASGDAAQPVGYGSVAGGRGSRGGSASGPSGPRPTAPVYNLSRLSADVGDVAVVNRFVADFLALLDGRLETIGDSVRASDDKRAIVAMLSLEASGALLGATGLVSRLRDLRCAVREARHEEATALLSSVQTAAEGLRHALQERDSPA
jgi:hypothetical protein